ncbi:hypothetical protein RhiirC2_715559, partial [Rhizophagus irregularis]
MPKNLWKILDYEKYEFLFSENSPESLFLRFICRCCQTDQNKYQMYQDHAIISTIVSTTQSEEINDKIVYMEDLEKRKQLNNDDESENVQSAYNNPELTYNSDNDNNIQSDSSSEYLLSESEKPRNLWKNFDWNKYQAHVNVTSTNFATKSEEINDSVIYMDDLEKRKE